MNRQVLHRLRTTTEQTLRCDKKHRKQIPRQLRTAEQNAEKCTAKSSQRVVAGVRHQLLAIYGWETLRQAEVYTRNAYFNRLAGEAMHCWFPATGTNKDKVSVAPWGTSVAPIAKSLIYRQSGGAPRRNRTADPIITNDRPKLFLGFARCYSTVAVLEKCRI